MGIERGEYPHQDWSLQEVQEMLISFLDKANFLSYIIDREIKPCLEIAVSTVPNLEVPIAFGIHTPIYLKRSLLQKM